jgi:hypothetical protein
LHTADFMPQANEHLLHVCLASKGNAVRPSRHLAFNGVLSVGPMRCGESAQ